MATIVEDLRSCAGAALAPKGSFLHAAIDMGKVSQRFTEAADALERIFIGGNHLALVIGADHPPYTATHEEARAHYYASGAPSRADIYEVWCCWKIIMECARGNCPPEADEAS